MLYQSILSLDVDCPFILKMASQQNVTISFCSTTIVGELGIDHSFCSTTIVGELGIDHSFCSTTIVGELGIDHSTLVVIKSRDGPSFSAITEDSGTTQVMIICAPW